MRLRSLIVPTLKFKDKSMISYFSDGTIMYFEKNDTILNGYEDPDGVYLIKKGFIKACSESITGDGNLLLIHESGEFIPLPWALDGSHFTGLSYKAMSDVTVIKTSKDKLRNAMGNNQWLSQEVLNQTVNVIALYTQRIQTLQFRSARERIIAEIIYLAKRFGREHGKAIIIDAPITHKDIADSISMNRETASRALELLFKEGYLIQIDHYFSVMNIDKLQSLIS